MTSDSCKLENNGGRSLDATMCTILTKLDNISSIKEEQRMTALKVFLSSDLLGTQIR